MEFLFGFLGAVAAMLLFFTGVFAGWKLRKLDDDRAHPVTAEQLTPEQRRQLQEEREALDALHSYNMDTAYGTPPHRKE